MCGIPISEAYVYNVRAEGGRRRMSQRGERERVDDKNRRRR